MTFVILQCICVVSSIWHEWDIKMVDPLCYQCRSSLKLRPTLTTLTMMSTIKIQRCCWTMGSLCVDINLGAWYSSRIWCRRLMHAKQNSFESSFLHPCESLLDLGPPQREPLWHILVYLRQAVRSHSIANTGTTTCQQFCSLGIHISSLLLCNSQDISRFFFPLPLFFWEIYKYLKLQS